jgi:hypothetical protein
MNVYMFTEFGVLAFCPKFLTCRADCENLALNQLGSN